MVVGGRETRMYLFKRWDRALAFKQVVKAADKEL